MCHVFRSLNELERNSAIPFSTIPTTTFIFSFSDSSLLSHRFHLSISLRSSFASHLSPFLNSTSTRFQHDILDRVTV